MDRWTWMTLRLYAPAVVVAAVTLLARIPISALAGGPFELAFQPILRWGTLAGALVTVALLGIASFRLWRWTEGKGAPPPPGKVLVALFLSVKRSSSHFAQ